MTITDTGNGFEVDDRKGHRVYADDQVVSVALQLQEKHSEGMLKFVNRTFRINVASGTVDEEILLKDKLMAGDADPHAALIKRLSENYAERARQALDAGMRLSGVNWSLDNAALTVGESPNAVVTPLSELTRCDIFDGSVGVWARGANDPVLKAKCESKNAFVLDLLLSPIIEQNGIEDDGEGLGHILFERKPSMATIVAMYFLGVAGIVAALVLLAIVLTGPREPVPLLIGAGIAAVLAPVFLIGGYSNSRTVFRCQSRGVYSESIFGQRELLYSEVGSFVYSLTRHYYNGVYTGTAVNMKFTPRDKMQKPVAYKTQSKNIDNDLDLIRDHVSQVIAHEMGQQLHNNQPAPWTANTVFHPEGIEYRPQGFFGRKDWTMLKYADMQGFNIDQGNFHLWEKGVKKSVIQESTSAENFFPGYYLLMMMTEDDDAE